jgi:hypothetical protein
MKKTAFFALCSAVFGFSSLFAEVDCLDLSLTVKHSVAADPSKVLEIVTAQVSAAPACSCEIVKGAIEGSNASVETVAAIVEAASTAAPEQMRLIGQCAVAVAPDALGQVQSVLAKFDPNLGESNTSAKGAKVAAERGEVAAAFNPLDFPGRGPVGPTPGGPGGLPLIPMLPPFIVSPPDVTNVNPGRGR